MNVDELIRWRVLDIAEDLWWIFYLRQALARDQVQPLVDHFLTLGLRLENDYAVGHRYSIILRDSERNDVFEMTNPSDRPAPHLFFGTASDYFIPPDSALVRLRADCILEFGKVIYHHLHPDYAFCESLGRYIELEELLHGKLTHLCWAQCFGPQVVERIGRAELAHAPAWRNENLEDGGLLYVLAATPYLGRGPRQYWQQARAYFAGLGLPLTLSTLPRR